MQRSPVLNTLARGQEAGTAKMSPRNASRAPSTATELVNSPTGAVRPAVARAEDAAGMTPPLATIAAKLKNAPSVTSQTPGTRRLARRKANANTYVPMWATSRHPP
jgi:hypothetical protein